MHNRLRLERLLTALLYIGPLLAGLAGQGGWMVLAFIAVFLLASVILHPDMWPRAAGDLGRADAAVALASVVATQALLVVVCFALGRGIGGVLGMVPALPPNLPLVISCFSVPLVRLARPRIVPWEEGAVTGSGLARLTPAALAPAMLATVVALPEDVTEEVLQDHLTAISAHLDPVLIRQMLGDAVARAAPQRAAVKALIVHATDPAVSDLMAGSAYPAQAFAAAGRDEELLTLFARRCAMALEDEPDLVTDCPSAAVVAEAAVRVGDGMARAALNRLSGLLA